MRSLWVYILLIGSALVLFWRLVDAQEDRDLALERVKQQDRLVLHVATCSECREKVVAAAGGQSVAHNDAKS